MPAKRRIAGVVVLFLGLIGNASCQSDRWTFFLTREAFDTTKRAQSTVNAEPRDPSRPPLTEDAFPAIAILLVLPIALDVLLLPITVTHDCCS